jgi:hypothetical protein
MKSLVSAIKKDKTEENDTEIEQWIQHLLENADEYKYLEGKTIENFKEETYNRIQRINGKLLEKYSGTIHLYRFIDNICDFRQGTFVRWISRSNPTKWSMGGKLLQIQFSNNHALVLVLILSNKRYKKIRYSMTNYYTFQKLTTEENMILLSNGIIAN